MYRFSLIYFGLGLEDPSKWGETFYERGFAVFADILGISRLLETESLNGAWWYMSAAFVFIILLPLLDGTIEKFGGIFCIAVIFFAFREFQVLDFWEAQSHIHFF